MISTEEFAESFAGHSIIACLVRSPKFFYFLTEENTQRTYDLKKKEK